MNKIPFKIEASAQGDTALIRITGTIGWDVDAESFRSQIDDLVNAKKIINAHLYLYGPGGSVFDADEICNIISSSFTGKVTGEGGSLVASAYTRIAQICDTFKMPENGAFMIHKPSGGISGTTNDIKAYLKLMEDKEGQYLELYKKRSKNVALLEQQWNAGDWWMTAKEAKENGFITDVLPDAKVSSEARAMIAACGCPETKIPKQTITQKYDEMDLKAMAKALGLPESATEAEINAAIASANAAKTELATLKAANEKKEKEAQAKIIKDEVATAVKEKRITADMEADWVEALSANYDLNSKLLKNMKAVSKISVTPSDNGKSEVKGKVTHEGKTFEELQEEDPETLGALMENDPDVFDALYNNYLKRNKLTK